MQHLGRRIATVLAVIIALPLSLVLAPFVLVIGTIVDLATGRSDLPIARLYLFFIVFLVHEWLIIPLAIWLWIRGGAGRQLDLWRHSELQGWWAGSLLRWADRLLGVEIRWPDFSTLPATTLLIVSRHASMADAIIPAHVFPAKLGRPVHYVLKRELRWLPSIDIFGHRLGNHFVDRKGDTDREVEAIADLARSAPLGAGLVIFPEGTYATDAKRARVRASLERRGDTELIELADQLAALLPPRAAGTLAMLDEQPHADVVVLGHVGLEGVAEVVGLRRNLPARRPIVVDFWIHARATVPDDDSERVRWLQEQWRHLDRWVADQRH